MKVNGYRLQQGIKEQKQRADLAAQRFSSGLVAFPGDDKPSPEKLMADYNDAETKLAALQVAQARFNLSVRLPVKALNGKEMTLHEAVKLVGSAGRAEKMWRTAASPPKERYSYSQDSLTRDKDAVVARPILKSEKCAELAKKASKFASALREAIQLANAKEVELDIDPSLLEDE